ncbi:MAG: hypothetical protein ACRDDZ_04250 [Marinifilaceae bacterium]
MRKFLHSKDVYMLVVLLLTAATVSIIHIYREIALDELFFGVVTYQIPYNALFASLCWYMGMLLLFAVNEHTKLLEQRSTLPATIYFFLTLATFWHVPSIRITFAAMLAMFGMSRLMRSYDEGTGNNTLFDTGALFTSAIILVPEFILLWLLGLLSTIFYGKQVGRGIIAYLIGVATILGIAEGIFYIAYGAPELVRSTVYSLNPEYHWLFDYAAAGWTVIGITLFLLLIALVKLWGSPRSYTIPLRKAKDTLQLSLLFSIISAVLFPDFWQSGIVYWLATSLALLYSNFIIHSKKDWINTIYFLLILVASGIWFAVR